MKALESDEQLAQHFPRHAGVLIVLKLGTEIWDRRKWAIHCWRTDSTPDSFHGVSPSWLLGEIPAGMDKPYACAACNGWLATHKDKDKLQNAVLIIGMVRRTVVETKSPSHQCLLMSQCMRN